MRAFMFAALAGLAVVGAAAAHPATEQYIPIGQSPGEGTVMGHAGVVVEPASDKAPIVSVMNEANVELGAYVVVPATRIYIDRSAQGLPNELGGIEDVQPGRVIEVRIADEATREAEWIKVRP